ncbi:MAG: hypothetical protein MRY74_16295 [Neomegalonema sp.]|nr:hypothetical protein [Neomegalonema sp.]
MEAGVVPGWVAQALPIILWATAALGAVWVVLAVLDYLNRRAYNLTMADRGGNGGAQPDFLRVDGDKREEARRAGEAFDEKMRARDAAEAGEPSAPNQSALSLTKIITLIFAVITAITVIVGAIGRIEYYDAAVRRLSSWERFVEIVNAYWPGFIIVALIVAAQIYHAIRHVRAG